MRQTKRRAKLPLIRSARCSSLAPFVRRSLCFLSRWVLLLFVSQRRFPDDSTLHTRNAQQPSCGCIQSMTPRLSSQLVGSFFFSLPGTKGAAKSAKGWYEILYAANCIFPPSWRSFYLPVRFPSGRLQASSSKTEDVFRSFFRWQQNYSKTNFCSCRRHVSLEIRHIRNRSVSWTLELSFTTHFCHIWLQLRAFRIYKLFWLLLWLLFDLISVIWMWLHAGKTNSMVGLWLNKQYRLLLTKYKLRVLLWHKRCPPPHTAWQETRDRPQEHCCPHSECDLLNIPSINYVVC